MGMGLIRLSIASHRPFLRHAIEHAAVADLNARLVTSFETHREALQDSNENTDLLVADATRTDGLYAAVAHARHRGTRVVVLSGAIGDYVVHRAFAAGATGVVCEDDAWTEWLEAMRVVAKGGVYQSPACAAAKAKAAFANTLTPQEHRVLELCAKGKSDEGVGAELGISSVTAEGHRTNVMRKLRVADAAALLTYCIAAGVVAAVEVDFRTRVRRSARGPRKRG